MLAEPRYKQKWADDPRNINWSKDKGKFGYKLMSKMGWSEGKGLGVNESGTVSHVKVSKRKEALGLGASVVHEDNWISHQDDFSALLSKLNQTSSKDSLEENEEQQSSLQNNVKQSQRKILYSKFIKSKDLASKSKNDLACVFGQRSSKSTPSTPQCLSEDDGEKSDTSTASCPVTTSPHEQTHGIVTVKSQMNLQEYFAQRMAAMKQRVAAKELDIVEKFGSAVDPNPVEESLCSGRDKKEKKLKKRKEKKRDLDRELEVVHEENSKVVSECFSENVECLKDTGGEKRRKNSKKSKRKEKDSGSDKTGSECNYNFDVNVGEDDLSSVRKKSKKNKKSKKADLDCDTVNEEEGLQSMQGILEADKVEGTKKKTSKKLRSDFDCLVMEINNSDCADDKDSEKSSKKTSRKKRKREQERTALEDNEIEVRSDCGKKKKRKKTGCQFDNDENDTKSEKQKKKKSRNL